MWQNHNRGEFVLSRDRTIVPAHRKETVMARKMMTWAQLVDVLCGLLQMGKRGDEFDVPRDVAQRIIKVIKEDPESFRNEFLKFLAGGAGIVRADWRVTIEPFDVVKTNERWSMSPKESLTGTSEIDFSTASFISPQPNENNVSWLARLKTEGNVPLGASACMGLWQDHLSHLRGHDSVLESIWRDEPFERLLFMGNVIKDPNNSHRVMSIKRCSTTGGPLANPNAIGNFALDPIPLYGRPDPKDMVVVYKT